MLAMQEEDFEREVKVVVVGNGCVGKTSMIRQFCKGVYNPEYKKTIGVDFLEKVQFVRGLDEDVKLMLWDTAGQEQFHAMTRSYYRGARVAALCFSTVDRASFEAIRSWKEKVEDECGEIPMVLVQNKVDLLENAAVSRQEAEELATELGLRFYRICVKENLYVSDVFEYLAELHLQRDLSYYHTHSIPPTCKPRSRKAAIAQAPQVDLKINQCKKTKVFNIRRRKRRDVLRSECSIL
ncbi:unnamed protein product [Calypogeia fissa]